MLPIFVAADQLADVFAAGAIASSGDLLVDELLQVIRQRNIHSAHRAKIAGMAKFGKVAGVVAALTKLDGRFGYLRVISKPSEMFLAHGLDQHMQVGSPFAEPDQRLFADFEVLRIVRLHAAGWEPFEHFAHLNAPLSSGTGHQFLPDVDPTAWALAICASARSASRAQHYVVTKHKAKL